MYEAKCSRLHCRHYGIVLRSSWRCDALLQAGAVVVGITVYDSLTSIDIRISESKTPENSSSDWQVGGRSVAGHSLRVEPVLSLGCNGANRDVEV